MSRIIDEYKRRRSKRLASRFDAGEEGRWVTTENDNHVHLNNNGIPDKGNPYVVAAMTGNKPKLSKRYQQKELNKAISDGDKGKIIKKLKELPKDSVLSFGGEKFIPHFEGEIGGFRTVSFQNAEDEDEFLSSIGMANMLIDNGDVSIDKMRDGEEEFEENVEELPDEMAYEPDIEPEDDPFDPDDDISFEDPDDLPYDMSGYGEETPQETPDNVPDSTSPQEVGASGGFTAQSFKDKIDEIKKNNPSETGLYSIGDAKPIADMLDQVPVGTVIKTEKMGWDCTKQPDGTWKDADIGAMESSHFAPDILECGISSYEAGEEVPEVQEQKSVVTSTGNWGGDLESAIKSAQDKGPSNHGSYSYEDVESITSLLDSAPNGTSFNTKNGLFSFTKTADGWKDVDDADGDSWTPVQVAKLAAKYSVSDVNEGGKEKSPEIKESAPVVSPAVKKAQDGVNKYLNDIKNPFAWASVTQLGQSLNDLEDGSTITIADKTYIKGTDKYGDVEFKNPDNEFDWLSATGVGNKIASEYSKALSGGKGNEFSVTVGGTGGLSETTGNVSETSSGGGSSLNNKIDTSSYKPPKAKKNDIVEFSEDDYSQSKKDSALWDTTGGKDYDDVMRNVTGAVWKQLSEEAKDALHAYTTEKKTGNYSQINGYLRKPDHGGQSEEMQRDMEERINKMTEAISQSVAPTDIWVQRGIPEENLRKLFNVSMWDFDDAAKDGPDAVFDLLQSSGVGMDNGFMSCGSTKGKGYSNKDVILNIYCPKGTQMIYAEPFANFGNGDGRSWDGESGQYSFSGEDETILQRGTMLRPTKVTRSNGTWYVDVEVTGQEYEQVGI